MNTSKPLTPRAIAWTIATGLVALISVASTRQPSAQLLLPSVAPPQQQEFANLGQLLNAGGKLLSPQEFNEEVVQRLLVGPLASGATVEVMYASSGALAGSLLHGGAANSATARNAPQNWQVSGDWRVDDSERICTTLRITYGQGITIVPTRCEFWFKIRNTYYVSEADEDRGAKLFVRVLKQ
jgi:hypothetical protein